ncbi:MAG: DNA translocase FtsK 4TM domain-containing protein, partial [Prevotellaceae bacterium]|nr:DNA translocase FtsK 4TM domain-containing protein [Prevotellaceae bacterium]
MAKKDSPKKETPKKRGFVGFIKDENTHRIAGVLLLVFCLYLLLAIVSFLFTITEDYSTNGTYANWGGKVGATLAAFFVNKGFGISFLFIIYFFVVLGVRLVGKKMASLWKTFFYMAFATIWFSLFFGFVFNHLPVETNVSFGGAHGKEMTEVLESKIAILGTLLLLMVSMFVFCLIAFRDKTIALTKLAFEKFKNLFKRKPKEENVPAKIEPEKEEEEGNETTWIIKDTGEKDETKEEDDDFVIVVPEDEDAVEQPEQEPEPEKSDFPAFKEESYDALAELGEYDPTLDLSHYRYPGIDLLREYSASETQVNMEEQTANKNKILSTLDSFGIKIATIKATVGPTITLYEIQPEAGVRISKIKNLEDDIALSLAALGIRIIAPIPGKGTIGIEVPNRDPQTVSMRSVITSKKFQEAKFDLPIALGKT